MQKYPRELYGESIFTSFRSFNGVVPGLGLHLKRLISHINIYFFNGSKSETELLLYFDLRDKLEAYLEKSENDYFRLTVFNAKRTEMLPIKFSLSDLELKIEFSPIDLKEDILSLELYPSPFTKYYLPIKSSSYIQHFHFKRQAKLNGFDDVLFFCEDYITEASTSNIVFLKKDTLIFPEASQTLDGVTQNLLQSFAKSFDLQVQIRKVSVRELEQFDGVMLLNSIQLIQAVSRINNIVFKTENVLAIRDKFLKALRVKNHD